jgi:tRNA(fMet)-specific endonuclease VapC
MSEGEQLLLDSNSVIHFFNGNPGTRELFARASKLVLCPPVLSELIYGAFESRRTDENLARLRAFQSGCRFLLVDDATATFFATIRHQLRQLGRPIPVNDMWIAALGIQYSLPVATVDAHLAVVPSLKVIGWEKG